MKRYTLRLLPIVLAIFFFMSDAPAKQDHDKINQAETHLFDFNNTQEIEAWRIVNDGVMGGLSKGEIVFSNRHTMMFKGVVSLENNGGFTSMRTRPRSYNLAGHMGIRLRVKGDGKIYQFRLRTNDRFDGISYGYKFETQPKTWMIITIPFHECVPVFRGRILENATPLVPEDIQQIGFLISNKKAEKFHLEIDWIKAYKK